MEVESTGKAAARWILQFAAVLVASAPSFLRRWRLERNPRMHVHYILVLKVGWIGWDGSFPFLPFVLLSSRRCRHLCFMAGSASAPTSPFPPPPPPPPPISLPPPPPPLLARQHESARPTRLAPHHIRRG